MINFLKNIPGIFFLYKKLNYGYKKAVLFLIGSKYFDRQFSEINATFEYLADKKSFIKKTFQPFNGQKMRINIIRKIFSKKIITEIYETGAYHGSTTEFLSRYKIPLKTCEISPASYFIAKDRLKKYRNVQIDNCDSYEFLKNNLKKSNKIIFFYLDAHKPDTLNPLIKELEVIFNNLNNFIVLIDDFLVPHDMGYGYDSINGSVLKVSYIRKFLKKENVTYFFPKKSSKLETGFKRGSIYICKGNESKKLCKSINELMLY